MAWCRLLILLVCLWPAIAKAQSLPKVVSGRIEQVDLAPRAIPARPIHVWLPDGYRAAGSDRYAVLYMHDGQMLFDPDQTWNHKAWQIDQVLGRLIAEGKVRPTILVAIDNGGPRRALEYTPAPAVAALTGEDRMAVERSLGGPPASDDYLRFIADELKPIIDRRYRTRSGPEDTVIMGSSMGGLISLYALIRYPDLFGGAACLSSHWTASTDFAWASQHGGAQNPLALALQSYLAQAEMPDPRHHRLYFDHGDQGLDSAYAPLQRQVDLVMIKAGYGAPANYRSLDFPGDDHDEVSWHRRLDQPLSFLLPPRSQVSAP